MDDYILDGDVMIDEFQNDDVLIVANPHLPLLVRARRDPIVWWRDTEFRERFRLNKPTVNFLVDLIRDEIDIGDRNGALTPDQQVLCALHILGGGTRLIGGGDSLNVHRSTASRAFHRVTAALCNHKNEFISMPSFREIAAVKRKFYEMGERRNNRRAIPVLPGVIGAVDCTHVLVKSPGGDHQELYRNRKQRMSINVQIISDADLMIRNVVARWPGSIHDATIWNNSRVCFDFENDQYPHCLLVGDNGYPCLPYLMTPVLRPTTIAERSYNAGHMRQRNVVERLNGVLKSRWRLLSSDSKLRYSPQRNATAIVAGAILHNIARIHGERDFPAPNRQPQPVFVHQPQNITGNAVRRALITTHF